MSVKDNNPLSLVSVCVRNDDLPPWCRCVDVSDDNPSPLRLSLDVRDEDHLSPSGPAANTALVDPKRLVVPLSVVSSLAAVPLISGSSAAAAFVVLLPAASSLVPLPAVASLVSSTAAALLTYSSAAAPSSG